MHTLSFLNNGWLDGASVALDKSLLPAEVGVSLEWDLDGYREIDKDTDIERICFILADIIDHYKIDSTITLHSHDKTCRIDNDIIDIYDTKILEDMIRKSFEGYE